MSRRLLFLGPLPPPVTGQALAHQALVEGLPDTEVEVIDTAKRHLAQGFTSLRHAFRLLGVAWRARRLAPRADTIYMGISQSIPGNLKDCLIWLLLGRTQRRKLVLHLHGGGIARTVYGRSGFLRWLNRRLLRDLRAVVVLGDSLRDVFAGIVPADRIRVVPNFAADEVYLESDAVAAKHREEPLRVLYLSNLFPSKGYGIVLEAAERTAGETGVHFDLAGGCIDDEQERTVRARVDALPHVDYHGVVEGAAKRELLARAQVLVLPSSYPYEGQPLCILEAYAAGCAVFTTDQGGILDVFTPAVHGSLLEKASVDSLCDALRAAGADRAGLAAIGVQNREAAEAYRLQRHLASMAEVLFPPRA